MPQQKIYLDDIGNPINPSGPVYLDDSGNPVARPQPEPAKPVDGRSLTDKLGSYLPSGRTVARVGGGAIGGAIGFGGGTILGTPVSGVGGAALGGAMGSSIGESVYQLATGESDPAVAAEQQRNALIQGGVQEAIPAAIMSRVPGALQRGTERTVANLSRPATEGEKAAVRKVATDAIPNMPVAMADDTLLKGYRQNLQAAARTLEQEYAAVPSTVKFKNTPFIGALQGLRDKYLVNGKVPPGAEPVIAAYDDMIAWFRANPNFTIEALRKNKQIWDNVVNYYRGALSREPVKEGVASEGADMIRNIIGTMYPKIAQANRQVHTWKTMVDSLARAEVKDVNRGSGLMKDVGPSIVGGGLGYLAGGPQGAALGAPIGEMIRRLVQTTAWQSASVPVRQAAIQAIQRGDVQAAIQALTATGADLAIKNVGVQKIDANSY